MKEIRSRRGFDGSPASVPAARRFVKEALAAHVGDGGDDLVSTAVLLVSELATNAVLYGGGDYEVSVAYSPASGDARVGVSDVGSGEPQVRSPEETAEHGRGLQLVAALSTSWGLDRTSPVAKTVWFELHVA